MGRNTDQSNRLLSDICEMAEAGTDETADRSLHICPQCGSKLVQPVSWKQEEQCYRWRVWRRCPECEWVCEAVHDEVAIDAFDEQLDLGSRELAEELRALEHTNMSEMADSFIHAMDGDLITADDFRV
jgi:uncharacterized protein with PIN domain